MKLPAEAWVFVGLLLLYVLLVVGGAVYDREDPCVDFGPERTETTYYAQSCGKDCTIMVPVTSTYRPCLRRQSDVPPEEKTDASAW